ncbi:hypothetical protein ACOMHN_063179 [Nucella lapillus]
MDSSMLTVAGRASCGEACVPACCRAGSGVYGRRGEAPGGSSHEKQQLGVCSVCGNKADGNFFGASVCLPCKSFFIRCKKDGEPSLVKQCQGNCDVTKQLRNRCQFCRFQRCLEVGMTRKEKPEVVLAEEGQTLCGVCGDLANGMHFGVLTCEGCKKFFRRGLKEHESYMCRSSRNCVLNPRNRNNCRYCRYQKCQAAGMSREAIKMGRPRKNLSKADSEETEVASGMTTADVKKTCSASVDTDQEASKQNLHAAHPDRHHQHPQQYTFGPSQGLTSLSFGETPDWISPSDGLCSTSWAGAGVSVDKSSVSFAAPGLANPASSGARTAPLFSAANQDRGLSALESSLGVTESPAMMRGNDPALLSFLLTSFDADSYAMLSEPPVHASTADPTRSDIFSVASSQTGQYSWTSSSTDPSTTRPMAYVGETGHEHLIGSFTVARNAGVAFPQQQAQPVRSQTEGVNTSGTFQSYQVSSSSFLPGQLTGLLESGSAPASTVLAANSAAMAASPASANLMLPGASSTLEQAPCAGTCGRPNCPFYAHNRHSRCGPHPDLSQKTGSAVQSSAQGDASSHQDQKGSSGVGHNRGGLDLDGSISVVQAGATVQRGSAKSAAELNRYQDTAEDTSRAVKIPRRDDSTTFDRPFGPPAQGGQEKPAFNTTINAYAGTLMPSRSTPSRPQAEETCEQTETAWPADPSTHSQTVQNAQSQPQLHLNSNFQGGEIPAKSAESLSQSDSGQQWTQQQQQQQQQQQDDAPRADRKDWRLGGTYDPYLDRDEMFSVNQVFVSVDTLTEAAEREENNPWDTPPGSHGAPSEIDMLEEVMQTQYQFSPRQAVHYWQKLASRCLQVTVGGQMPAKHQQILDSMLQSYLELVEASDNSKFESSETGVSSVWPQDDRVRTYWKVIQRRIVRGTQCCIKCAHQVPGMENLHPNDKNLLIRRDVIFTVGLLSAATVFFDEEKKDFRHFFNWKLGHDHPMAMFRQRLVGIGRKIFAQQMDLNEIALLFALNIICPGVRKMSPKHRMKSLFNLMPRMRMMGVWHGCLLKNMKFDTNLTKINIDNIQLDDS